MVLRDNRSMTPASRRMTGAALFTTLALAAACTDTLPDQDRRITVSPPAFKLSAEVLWADYKAGVTDADARYKGRAIEISGQVTTIEQAPARLIFAVETPLGIQANLLDDQAGEIIAAARVGERLMLKCFVAGKTDHIVLKSCVRP